nr:transposase [Escherichia coli]
MTRCSYCQDVTAEKDAVLVAFVLAWETLALDDAWTFWTPCGRYIRDARKMAEKTAPLAEGSG